MVNSMDSKETDEVLANNKKKEAAAQTKKARTILGEQTTSKGSLITGNIEGTLHGATFSLFTTHNTLTLLRDGVGRFIFLPAQLGLLVVNLGFSVAALIQAKNKNAGLMGTLMMDVVSVALAATAIVGGLAASVAFGLIAPILMVTSLTINSAYNAGLSIFNLYKWFSGRNKDSALVNQRYLAEAKAYAIGAGISALITVGASLLMVAKIAPLVMSIGCAAVSFMGAIYGAGRMVSQTLNQRKQQTAVALSPAPEGKARQENELAKTDTSAAQMEIASSKKEASFTDYRQEAHRSLEVAKRFESTADIYGGYGYQKDEALHYLITEIDQKKNALQDGLDSLKNSTLKSWVQKDKLLLKIDALDQLYQCLTKEPHVPTSIKSVQDQPSPAGSASRVELLHKLVVGLDRRVFQSFWRKKSDVLDIFQAAETYCEHMDKKEDLQQATSAVEDAPKFTNTDAPKPQADEKSSAPHLHH